LQPFFVVALRAPLRGCVKPVPRLDRGGHTCATAVPYAGADRVLALRGRCPRYHARPAHRGRVPAPQEGCAQADYAVGQPDPCRAPPGCCPRRGWLAAPRPPAHHRGPSEAKRRRGRASMLWLGPAAPRPPEVVPPCQAVARGPGSAGAVPLGAYRARRSRPPDRARARPGNRVCAARACAPRQPLPAPPGPVRRVVAAPRAAVCRGATLERRGAAPPPGKAGPRTGLPVPPRLAKAACRAAARRRASLRRGRPAMRNAHPRQGPAARCRARAGDEASAEDGAAAPMLAPGRRGRPRPRRPWGAVLAPTLGAAPGTPVSRRRTHALHSDRARSRRRASPAAPSRQGSRAVRRQSIV
jgi:hypothetical protein